MKRRKLLRTLTNATTGAVCAVAGVALTGGLAIVGGAALTTLALTGALSLTIAGSYFEPVEAIAIVTPSGRVLSVAYIQ